MVRLTADVITQSYAFMNPVQERELDLRGYKIPAIENLGVTQDQFDTIDFSDNEIKKLENFPKMKRLKTIFLNNNKVVRAEEGLGEQLPNLDTLILTRNQVNNLHDIDSLASLKSLRTLSLLGNGVTKKPHFREYVIHKIPSLKLLDFRKIRRKEREASAALFGSDKGKALEKQIAEEAKQAKTFVPGEAKPNELTAAQINKIKEAIANSQSLAEVTQLETALRTGDIDHLSIFQAAPTTTEKDKNTTPAAPASTTKQASVQEEEAVDKMDTSGDGDTVQAEETLTADDVKGMKVVQLKAALTERGLDTNGLKAVLAKRLLDHIQK